MRLYGLEEAIELHRARLRHLRGMILLDRAHLRLVDVAVARNGRPWLQSFEADLDLADGGAPLRGVFIRAPRVAETGPGRGGARHHEDVPVLLGKGGSSSRRSIPS